MPTFYDPVTGRPYNLAMEQGPYAQRGGGVGSLPVSSTQQSTMRFGGVGSLPNRQSMFQQNPSVINSPYGYDGQMRYKEGSPGAQFLNQSGQPANPSFTTPSSWMPQELMPQYGRSERPRGKSYKSKSGGRPIVPLNWNYTGSTMPPGAGTGGYYPGVGGEAQAQVKQNAVGNFIQYARQQGAGERQIQQGVAAIMGGGMPGGGGGGGGGSGQLSDLVSEFQKAQDKANAANEARYRDILAGYQDRYARTMGNLQGMGQQEAADINEAAKARAAAQRQSLVARGLSNSTITDNMEQGVERERVSDMGRLQERLRQQMLGLDTSLSGDTLNFMERREDTGPDMNQLLQLAQMLGMSGLAGGQVNQVPALMGGGVDFANAFGAGGLFQNPMAGLAGMAMGGYRPHREKPYGYRPKPPRGGIPRGAGDLGWGVDAPPGGIPDWAAFTA